MSLDRALNLTPNELNTALRKIQKQDYMSPAIDPNFKATHKGHNGKLYQLLAHGHDINNDPIVVLRSRIGEVLSVSNTTFLEVLPDGVARFTVHVDNPFRID